MKDNGLVERLRDAAVTVASGLELQRVLQTVRRRGGSSDTTSMMLEYTRSKEELERLLLVEDRERIDRDLHDSVIQRLFATGLEL